MSSTKNVSLDLKSNFSHFAHVAIDKLLKARYETLFWDQEVNDVMLFPSHSHSKKKREIDKRVAITAAATD